MIEYHYARLFVWVFAISLIVISTIRYICNVRCMKKWEKDKK